METNLKQDELQQLIEKSFKHGSMLQSLHHYPKDGEEVTLKIEKELLPYTHDTVHLLSPHLHHERNLLYMYIEELIQMLSLLKEEGTVDAKLLSVAETLLLALDYLTHERFIQSTFTEQDKLELQEIIKGCFDEVKEHSFSTDANRPVLYKTKWLQKEDKVYALDLREEKIRIYMAVFYQKPESLKEHMRQVGHWLGQVDLKPNGSRISYEEYCSGMTDHELHQDLLFYFNMVKRALAWFFNTCSWRDGILRFFDEMDMCSKLGIRD